ncbi:hypothetical protein MLD38_009136 [Melastoma candidum]|uniref:Uncharacterized protein n=2 Tax=Melastoma candidum TaxID=119954 RepID=A0ACB9RW81_9MYRT|nr:hypothetical protein MLD38_009136 [Melastoma candidum]
MDDFAPPPLARNMAPSQFSSPVTNSLHSPSPEHSDTLSQDLDSDAPLPEEESLTPVTSTPTKPKPKDGNTTGSLSHAPAPSDKKKNNEGIKIVLTAVASAAVTSLVLALLFAVCNKPKKKRDDPRKMQKDDRPLLNLTSDFSAGK